MDKLTLHILSFLIGIILYKLLNDKELFNVSIKDDINISQNLILSAKSCDNKPKNIIGFIQSSWDIDVGDRPESLKDLIFNSDFTVLIDAFLVNYQFCWIDPEAHNADGTSITSEECLKFWNGLPGGSDWPNDCGAGNDACCNFNDQCEEWYEENLTSTKGGPAKAVNCSKTSFSETGTTFQVIKQIIQLPNAPYFDGGKIRPKLLLSFGGWLMGGSSNGELVEPADDDSPLSKCLNNPELSGENIYNHIVSIKVNDAQAPINKYQVYNGIDIDIETNKAWSETYEGNNEQKTIDGIYRLIKTIYDLAMPSRQPGYPHGKFHLSTSPRASDIYDEHGNQGFMGKVIDLLSVEGIYFDYINPQFYNDEPNKNIPTIDSDKNLIAGSGAMDQLNKILKEYNNNDTSINVGMLSKNNLGFIDGNIIGSDDLITNKNPGVNSKELVHLWNDIVDKISEPKNNLGIMTWYINKSNEIIDSNIRPTASGKISTIAKCNIGSNCPGEGIPPNILNDINNWNWASELMNN